ncbi:MAG: peptidase M22 [Ruminococcaceae bacterium]|nr:peptidase M22 [Oscillospiraceae bacterium]
MLFLGIDTSNYTTSAAICDEDANILANVKVPLPVREGERGLRQSDAVFHHVKNLPLAAERLKEMLSASDERIAAVGCSVSPRDTEGSYMPCFLSGLASAEMISATHGINLYRVSHQRGHIMAALLSACRNSGENPEEMMKQNFIAFHVSGGTTDVLLCEPDQELVFKVTQIGGSRDINAGQAIDRTGVRMGLHFPCGAEMDKAALTYEGKLNSPKLSVSGTWCNLSGLENKSAELYQKKEDIAQTSAYTLDFIAKTLEKITKNAIEQYGSLPIIYAGGVMSSSYIRKTLSQYGMFADAQYSSDNAAGVAALASVIYRREKNNEQY